MAKKTKKKSAPNRAPKAKPKKKEVSVVKASEESSIKLKGYEEIDDELAAKAAGKLQALRSKGVQVFAEMGGVILKTFFKGDIELFKKHGGQHQTLAHVIDVYDVGAKSSLWYAVYTHVQFELLAEVDPELALSLSKEHHRQLTKLKVYPKELKLLAAKSVKGKWSAIDLGKAVDKALDKIAQNPKKKDEKEKRGRPSFHPFAKGASLLAKGLDEALSAELSHDALSYLLREGGTAEQIKNRKEIKSKLLDDLESVEAKFKQFLALKKKAVAQLSVLEAKVG